MTLIRYRTVRGVPRMEHVTINRDRGDNSGSYFVFRFRNLWVKINESIQSVGILQGWNVFQLKTMGIYERGSIANT